MSKALGEWVAAQLERRKCAQKEVALQIHGQLEADADVTVSSKLSKLLNGDPEGIRYFFDPARPDRLAALASAIGCPVGDLSREKERLARRRSLVIDPRLAATVQLELSRLAERAEGFVVVRVDAIAEVPLALRDAARAADNALVVLSEQRDLDALKLADIACSLVTEVPRGLQLTDFPDLIPVPPPRPPEMFDPAGTPLIPILDPWRPSYGATQYETYERYVRPADRREETPALPLALALDWFSRHEGPLPGPYGYGSANHLVTWVATPTFTVATLLGSEERTQVWSEGPEIYAVGPHLETLRGLLSPHEIQTPAVLRNWHEAARNANPWRLAEEVEATDHPLHAQVHAVKKWSQGAGEALVAELAKATTSIGNLTMQDEALEAREVVRQLSQRGVPAPIAEVALVLRRLAEAPWILFPESAVDLEVIADMGAGTVVSLRARRVRSAPAECRWVTGSRQEAYDFGDLVICIAFRSDVRLEGPMLPGRKRRRDEAARSSDDD